MSPWDTRKPRKEPVGEVSGGAKRNPSRLSAIVFHIPWELSKTLSEYAVYMVKLLSKPVSMWTLDRVDNFKSMCSNETL